MLPLLALLLVATQEQSLDPARLLSNQVVVYLEGENLATILAQRETDAFARAISASPFASTIGATLDEDARTKLAHLETILGGSTCDGLAQLARRGFGLGISYKRNQPVFVAVADAGDEAWLRATIERALDDVAKQGKFDRKLLVPEEEDEDTETWNLGALHMARRGTFLCIASNERVMGETLQRESGTLSGSLASREDFTAARATRPEGALIWGWIDAVKLRSSGAGAGPLVGLFALAKDPGANYLLGAPLANIGSATSWSIGARVEGTALELTLHAPGLTMPAELSATTRAAGLPAPEAPSAQVAELVVHRDVAALYARRAELFRPEVAPQMAQKLAELALLFGGRDVGEEVLPLIGPWIHVVSRPAKFENGFTPEIELPAAAFVLELRDAEHSGATLTAAFQTTVGIVNADRAQKKKTPFLLTLEKEGDVDVSAARALPPKAGEGVDASYNFAPACARVGDRFVIGTHASLVHELVRDLKSDRARIATSGDRLTLAGPAVAGYLEKNRDALVASNMLEKGHTAEEARRDVDVLIGIARSVAKLTMSVDTPKSDALDVALRLDLVPAPPRTRDAK